MLTSINTFKRTTLVAALCLSFAATGCDCGSSGDDGDGDDDAGVGEPSIASSRAKLRFKDGTRMENDLAAILNIDKSELCQELGLYSCVGEIHTISLLGVEPYALGFYEPLKETAATTPIAVERVVVSACSLRAERDFATPGSAEIYAGLPVSGGAITDTADPAVAAAIDKLYTRSMLRHATAEEIAHHIDLYTEIVDAQIADPALNWAKGSCFATLTTLETLFY